MKEIKRYLDNRIGDYSFCFEDLSSSYVYAHDENVVMTAAGCMKLPIAIALLKSIENNHISLRDNVNISDEDMVYGHGIIHEFGAREYSVEELMIAMLIQSDNTAANKIIETLGIISINETIKEMGLKNTLLNRKTIDKRINKGNVENLSTSADLSKCWRILSNGGFLNKDNSHKLINILKRQQIKDKIPFYMPEDIKFNVASKSGDLKGIENDTALITTTKGNFTFTIMSRNLPNNIYGAVTITRIGKMVWDMIANDFYYDEVDVTSDFIL